MEYAEFSPKKRRKGGKFLPAFCNILGTLILLLAIASCLPMVIPRLMGYQIYNVVTGSMEPEIPVGSVLYVEYTEPEVLEEGEVIAFDNGEGVIAHRVVENRRVAGEITTKGDANADVDLYPVEYSAVIGRVVRHYPVLGALMDLYSSPVGKVYVVIFAASGAMMNLIAGRIRTTRKEREQYNG